MFISHFELFNNNSKLLIIIIFNNNLKIIQISNNWI